MQSSILGSTSDIIPIDPVGEVRKKVDGRRPWTPFPTDLLRGVFGDYVSAIARDMDADEATVANLFLGLISGVIGTRWYIKVHPLGCGEYRQPAFLWTANVINSGGNKSGVFQAVLKAAQYIDGVLIDQSQQSRDEYQFQLAEWEAGLSEHRKQWRECTSESARKQMTMKYKDRKPSQPRNRRFLTGNATTGAIQLLLKSNPHGLLCAYDELRSWAASMGQFSKNREAGAGEKAEWLSFFNGGRVAVDRKGLDSPSIVVNHTGVSLVGSIQTSVLKRMVTAEDLENGLVTRLLTVWPPQRLRLLPENVTDEAGEFYLRVAELMKKIFHMENCANCPPPGESSIDQELARDDAIDWQTHPTFWVTPGGVRDLCLSKHARTDFIAWQHANEQARDREANELIKSLHPKIETFVLRFALVDHVCLHAEAGSLEAEDFRTIGIDSIRRAIQLAEWYFQEQKRVYHEVLEQPEESENEKCLRLHDWIARRIESGEAEFRTGVSSRQVQRAFGWSADESAGRLEMMAADRPDALLVKTETKAANHKIVARFSINSQRIRGDGPVDTPEEGDTSTL